MGDQQITESQTRQVGQSPILAVIGGSGKEGNALATRFARAGVAVILGSRDESRGRNAAQAMNQRLGLTVVQGMSNRAAAERASIILLAVPFDGMQPILDDLRDAVQGKVVINIASSLDPVKKSRARVPPAGSTTAEVQGFFGDNVKVLAAFQNIAPEKLEGNEPIDSDVLVCGADRDARTTVIGMIRQAGIDAFDAGVLANAVAVETMTAVLIAVNIRYKVKGAGIRLTGVPRS